MKRLVPIVSVFAMMILIVTGTVTAQDETPVAPDPAMCTLTPPSFDEIAMVAASPAPESAVSIVGTPTFELPAGKPVDDATREAVEASMIVNVACLNTGSILLTLAAYTPEGLGRIIGGFGAITQEEYDLLATPEAIPESEQAVIIEFQDMVIVPDGRIAAIIVGDNQADDDEPASATLFYLAEQDGHWYIDDFVNPDD